MTIGTPRVAVIGAGWAGASCAYHLASNGVDCEIIERGEQVGGHSALSTLNGVLYEPNGPHVFHTSNAEVCNLVQRFGMRRAYRHCVHSAVELEPDAELVLLSWPPQLDELRSLPHWPAINKELEHRPERADPTNFETWVASLVGETIYRLFVYGYTVKQWGCEPTQLSAAFAKQRIELRSDGDPRLFHDQWEFWPPNGVGEIIDRMVHGIPVTFGRAVTLADGFEAVEREFDAVVVTAALDEFAGTHDPLAWRGITIVPRYEVMSDPSATLTTGYQVNQPSLRVPYTRTVETKWASGQQIEATVVCDEYADGWSRHYPVLTPEREHERRNGELKNEVRTSAARPVFFCGRLANYEYIDQDQAVAQGLATARNVMDHFRT